MSRVIESKRYVASRFNVKVRVGDGLVVYNSLTGAIGMVLPKNRDAKFS